MNFDVKIAKGLENLPKASDVRRKVFIEEQGFVNEFDDIDARAIHVLISDGEKPVATGRLFEGNDGWHIGRIAVLSEYRGNRLGEKVMLVLHNYAKKNNIKEIILSAQVQASGFYEKLGYINLADLHMDENCPHVTMKKIL